jgi:hypothetical protein
MRASTGEKTPSGGKEKSFFGKFLDKLRKRHIIETLAAFIGGGWLLLEFVHWILVDHYHFPEKTIDITFVTLLGALLTTLILEVYPINWTIGGPAEGAFRARREAGSGVCDENILPGFRAAGVHDFRSSAVYDSL